MNKFESYLKYIFDYLPQDTTVDAMYYSLLNSGKRVRSQLFFKTLECFGISNQYLEVAAALEMIHTYSLIHDDLPAMDNATLRRGKPCSHIQYNEAIAILAGDGLLTESFNILTNLNLNSSIIIEIIKEFTNAAGCNGMIYGQELDILNENRLIDQSLLTKIHNHKTGKMIILPVRIALIIANQKELLPTFTNALEKFGLAFQVKDDLLDLSNENEIGKDSNDQILNKSTYLKLLGYEQSLNYYNELIQQSIQSIRQAGKTFEPLYLYMQQLSERNK